MKIKSIILISILVLGFLVPVVISDIPEEKDSCILPVEPITQHWPGTCYSTSLAMIMKFYDDNYNTNYLGRPYDKGLFIEFSASMTMYNLCMILYGHPVGSTVINKINVWADYRNQTNATSVTTYRDHTVMGGNPDTDITYDLIRNELQKGAPVTFSVRGHSSVAIGWRDSTQEIIIYNTWDNDIHYLKVDDLVESDRWYVRSVHVFDFDLCTGHECIFTGDINGDGALNSADIRHLVLYIIGRPGYEYIFTNPDIDSNNIVNTDDAIYLFMYIVGDPEYGELYP